jgi:hypothetical protein
MEVVGMRNNQKGMAGRVAMAAALVVMVLVAGCATNPNAGQPGLLESVGNGFNSIFNSPDPCSNNDRNIGMAVGAVLGGVVAATQFGKKNLLAGALLGTGAGALIGHVLDSPQWSTSL